VAPVAKNQDGSSITGPVLERFNVNRSASTVAMRSLVYQRPVTLDTSKATQHSRGVAAMSRQLTLMVGAGDPGEAYLAGLLHDIGKPIVASLLVKAENRLLGTETNVWLDPDTWMSIVQNGHRPVGVALAKKWMLPEAVVSTVANCSTYDEQTPCSIVNCVRLANALTKEAHLYVGTFDENEVTGVLSLGQSILKLTDDDMTGIRKELSASSRE